LVSFLSAKGNRVGRREQAFKEKGEKSKTHSISFILFTYEKLKIMK